MTYRVVVAVSGRGSNCIALADALGRTPVARITAIVSDRSAAALDLAMARGIPSHKLADFRDGAEWLRVLDEAGCELLVLAGYLRLVPPEVVARFRGRIINVHPALLPRFGGAGMHGARVHQAVLDANEVLSGATVHLVDEVYDRGEILGQATVTVDPGMSATELAQRVLQLEHRLLPAAVIAAARAGHPVHFALDSREQVQMPRALISVSDKRGIQAFAEGLVRLGWEIVSTGGTATLLRQGGVPVTTVDQVTGFPEILDGRVKTLHPAVHAGLLARADRAEHVRQLQEHSLAPFGLVAVNLYPFQATIANANVTFETAIENIDIGGPSMLRSAAKNFEFVLPVVDPRDYTRVLELLAAGDIPLDVRRDFAAKVFSHTSDYDNAVAGYLTPRRDELPERVTLSMERRQVLRYGENPQQRAALYANDEPRGIGDLSQRQGKELSFNNLLDIDAAMSAVAAWPNRVACAVIKHTTPCGIALGRNAADAFVRARATDPTSAFGSVIAFNTVVDRAAADALADLFVEVVVAPAFHADALARFAEKKNLRVVELPITRAEHGLDWKKIRGGFLIQDQFRFNPSEDQWRVVTARAPSHDEMNDLRFAWAAVATVKSNAILLARGEQAIGIGAGQMSRVDASFLAAHKARQAGHATDGAVLASDGFFPFPDGVEQAAAAGVTAFIQPGGSVNDTKVIDAANVLGVAMVMTGQRMFRH